MIQKLLGFDKQTMRIRTEVIAGITGFLTPSYILAAEPIHPGNYRYGQRSSFYGHGSGFRNCHPAPRLYGQTAVRTGT